MPWRIWLFLTLLAGLFPSPAQPGDVPSSPTDVRPGLIGSAIPDAILRSTDDEETTLHAALGDTRAVLVYYRGGW